jgi:hypothetical protein
MELERAQWALKPSARPVAAPPDAAVRETSVASSRTHVRSSQEMARDAASQTTFRKTEQATGNAAAAKLPSSNAAASSRQPTAFTAVTQVRPRPQEAAGAPPQAAGAPRPQRVLWQRVNVHAMVREGAADVWVRDASLERGGRRRLAAELGERLRAAGLRRGALYLNGEEINLNGEDIT